jgi:N-ethylmaleimide reductase
LLEATTKGRYVLTLFTPYQLGQSELKNRVVMASMTRGRTTNPAHIPNELQLQYYRQRAGAGLILTEGTWVSQDAIGFINVPGLFSAAQIYGWRKVTDAVHDEDGVIFAQLAHSGAVSHPDFFKGELPLAPSAVNPGLRAFTPVGFKDTVTPRAMTLADILRTVSDYRSAARNAQEAGFDGVELHCATTYLLPQFLNSELNIRDDAYGGSAENRCRIVLDTLNELIGVWGPGRVGVKISPTMSQGGFRPTDATVETYDYLVARLNRLPLSHLQILRAAGDLSGTPVEALQDTVGYYRSRFEGTIIANLGYDKASATSLIERGGADLVSFAKPFISNPDLVRRFERDLPLTAPVAETFYQGGSEGYVDYAPAA